MRPLHISFNNFLIYRGIHDVDFSAITNCVVSGMNASGKSTLLIDGILFSLFGKCRQNGSDCVSLGEESGYVEFTFIHHDAIYNINREMLSNKVGMKLRICKNGELLTFSTYTQAQNHLEKEILGFSQQLFLHICCSVQGQIDNFSQQTPAEKQELLSELLQSEDWENRKKLASEKYKYANNLKGNVDIYIEEFTKKKEKKKIIEENISIYKIKERETVASLNKLQKEIDQASPEIENIAKNNLLKHHYLTHKNKCIVDIEKNSIKLNKIEESKSFIDTHDIAPLLQKIKINQTNTIEVNNILLELYQKNKYWSEKLSIYEQLEIGIKETSFIEQVPCSGLDIHSQCQLLFSAIEKRTTLLSKIDSLQIKDLTKEKNDLIYKIKIVTETINENLELFKNLSDESSKLKKEQQKLETELQIHTQILNLNDNYEDIIERNSILEKEIQDCIQKLEQFSLDKEKEQTYNKLIDKKNDMTGVLQNIIKESFYFQESLKEITIECENLSNEIKKTEGILQDIKNWKILIDTYDSIPTLLLTELIPIIEEESNKILQVLGVEYAMKIVVFQDNKTNSRQRRAFDIVYNSVNGPIQFTSLSGSEKFKQALAFRIALSKTLEQLTGIHIGMFIIDEGWGSLDSEGIKDMKQLLIPLSQQFEFFCIITHTLELQDAFDTQIIVHPGEKNKIEVLTNQ